MSDNKDQLRKAYGIIPPDYLHRIEGEDHFTLISEEELEKIVEHCVINNGFDTDEIMQVVRHFEQARCGALTIQRFFDGQLDILDLTADGDIIWRAS